MIEIPERVAERAYSCYTVSSDGCLISTYSVASHGYSQIGWCANGKRTMTTAHRAAWVHANGQIPAGMTVDHICKTRRCVHVDHLRLLTNFENARRTSGRDWPIGECANGHPNSELVVWAGRIRCRLCTAGRQRNWRQRNRDTYNQRQRERRRRHKEARAA